jgi:hypothetical protein
VEMQIVFFKMGTRRGVKLKYFLCELYDLEIIFPNCTTQYHPESKNSTALVSGPGLLLATSLRSLLSEEIDCADPNTVRLSPPEIK